MTTDLHKRLEEAADRYIKTTTPDDIPYYHKDVKQGFIAGVEHGYKEAIKMAKEWFECNLEDSEDYFDEEELCWIGRDKFLSNFEAEMNKLWEEKK